MTTTAPTAGEFSDLAAEYEQYVNTPEEHHTPVDVRRCQIIARACRLAAEAARAVPVAGTAYTLVRVDTTPDAEGWCFCTPASHPSDVERGLKEEFDETQQILARVVNAPPAAPDRFRDGLEAAARLIEELGKNNVGMIHEVNRREAAAIRNLAKE